MRTRLSTKGQLVLPKEVRVQLGWQPGDTLDARVTDDGQVLLRRMPASAYDRVYGMFKAEAGTAPATEGLLEDRRHDLEREERKYAAFHEHGLAGLSMLAESRPEYQLHEEGSASGPGALREWVLRPWPTPPTWRLEQDGTLKRAG